MKKCFLFLLMAVSCQTLGVLGEGKGELRISFCDGILTKVNEDIPDTSDFLLTVTGPDGDIVYDGSYGASPESIMVDEGSYTIYVRSCDFKAPAFSVPQYGERQCVVVPSGGVADVKLTCVQMNAGIRLRIDESFLKNCPDAALFLKSAQGKLMYSYSERRIAYFLPENVSLMMSDKGVDKILFTRTLAAQTVLEMSVSAAGGGSKENINVAVDTSRNWTSDSYVIGGPQDKGEDISGALNVAQALESVGETDVWVCGYIVGGDLSQTSASFEPPFEARTNLLLGARSSVDSRESCLAVNLSSGDVRDELNLVDNPAMLGRKVYLKGDITEAYFGMPGLKNITDYDIR